jgi:hypothetical protein
MQPRSGVPSRNGVGTQTTAMSKPASVAGSSVGRYRPVLAAVSRSSLVMSST